MFRTMTISMTLLALTAGSAIAAPKAKANVTDLGVLAGDGTKGPGDVLKGKVEKVGPGGTLTFIAPTNQIWGLGEVTVEPAGAAKIKQTLVKAKVPGALGGATYYRYSITLPKSATTPVTIKTSANYQTRNSPSWAFSFKVSPEKPAASAAEYHPIPLIPGYMGGSDVPGANVGRSVDSRGAASTQTARTPSAGAGIAR